MEILPDPIHVALLTLPFVVAVIGLHLILWRPLLAHLDARDHHSARARHEAEELDGAAAEQLAKIEVRLGAARQMVATLRHDARARALAKETEIIGAARSQADARISAALDEIATESRAAAATLQATAAELSTGIAGQVLGRELTSGAKRRR